jgi:hypothetical protein
LPAGRWPCFGTFSVPAGTRGCCPWAGPSWAGAMMQGGMGCMARGCTRAKPGWPGPRANGKVRRCEVAKLLHELADLRREPSVLAVVPIEAKASLGRSGSPPGGLARMRTGSRSGAGEMPHGRAPAGARGWLPKGPGRPGLGRCLLGGWYCLASDRFRLSCAAEMPGLRYLPPPSQSLMNDPCYYHKMEHRSKWAPGL